jgi:hypothetical protein
MQYFFRKQISSCCGPNFYRQNIEISTNKRLVKRAYLAKYVHWMCFSSVAEHTIKVFVNASRDA